MNSTKGDGSVLYLSDFINFLEKVSKVQNRTVPFCTALPFCAIQNRSS